MGVRDNAKTCGAYFLYVLTLLWLLTKEFLGYPVDWSQHPLLIPERHDGASESLAEKPMRRKAVLEKIQDLEANLIIAKPLSIRSATKVADISEKLAKEKWRTQSDSLSAVIYQTGPERTAAFNACNDPILPLYSAQLQAHEQPRTEPKIEDGSTIRIDSSTDAAFCESASVKARKLDGRITSALDDALQQHQELENATSNRLNFVKTLKYTENSSGLFSIFPYIVRSADINSREPEFKFPTLLAVLRHGSQRTIKGNIKGTQSINDTAINPSPTSCLQDTTSSVLDASTASDPTTPHTPKTPASPCSPLSPLPASASSASTYSSSYTITEASYNELSTPADEDIPIHLISLPSWRQDPDRAKFVFGSLARGASETGTTSISLEPSVVVVEDAATNPLDEDRILETHFESMIIAMGLAPTPAASTFDPGEGGPNASGSFPPGTGMKSVKSRESIMGDVLSWVDSSS
jgi:hypothetical protein